MTVRQFLQAASHKLRESGIQDPGVDAEILLSLALGVRRDRLLLRFDEELQQDELDRASKLIGKRTSRVPLQYIVGTVEFMGLEFLVRPGVFIPRPETEFVVVEAITILEHVADPLVVDVCTASGVIGVSIAAARPTAVVHAVDISDAAIDLARANAVRHGVQGRIFFHLGDLFAAAGLEPLRTKVDVITANPPYIPSAEIPVLEPEVSVHEPLRALDGGTDGLVLLRRILSEGSPLLKTGGWFVVEIGAGQAQAAVEAARSARLAEIRTVRDLAGIERVLVARKG